jgi:hypothetical protein
MVTRSSGPCGKLRDVEKPGYRVFESGPHGLEESLDDRVTMSRPRYYWGPWKV